MRPAGCGRKHGEEPNQQQSGLGLTDLRDVGLASLQVPGMDKCVPRRTREHALRVEVHQVLVHRERQIVSAIQQLVPYRVVAGKARSRAPITLDERLEARDQST
ncbi:MAG TPA: hypothetical protein VFV67_31460 [Actinophytocola sp.]|uniref:hypothetical protein n=1 Tax=Actinophytocola sp. TaxID=1872138 RepID=UPI002DB9DE06|nr:hypothetical protein [Actinophytocola sp.]HEU5475185.1 hypothetical protein [Actinophytocola sp.]